MLIFNRNKLVKDATILLMAFPVILLAVFCSTYPFAEALAVRKFSMSELSSAQKCNIEQAARAINGCVLRPHARFSFNRVVGPRTEARGYRAAPSYLGPENPATVGGGICLLSSALYQLALETGLQVDERNPHLRTVKTVPAGLDATVWYGRSDLVFENTLSVPVQIATNWDHQTLTVTLLGRKPNGFEGAKLQRVVSRSTSSDLIVEIFREQQHHCSLVTRDHYTVCN